MRQGARDYVVKPVNRDELLAEDRRAALTTARTAIPTADRDR